MTDKSVQFHASPSDMDEVIAILRRSVPGVRLYAWTRCHTLREIVAADIGADADRLVACDVSLEPYQGGFGALLDTWPGLLLIDLPVLRDGSLREVGVSARSLDERGTARMDAWARFIRQLRRTFKSGAFLCDAISGAGLATIRRGAAGIRRARALRLFRGGTVISSSKRRNKRP